VESKRERTASIPPSQGRKVLRPGVRLIADQFPPYDETPEDELLPQPYFGNFHSMMYSSVRQMGKSIQKIGEAMKGVEAKTLWTDETSDPLTDLEKAIKMVEESPSLFKNDGNTFKLPRQTDPYYIKFEKRKRR